jgi:methionyl aminopeptidase
MIPIKSPKEIDKMRQACRTASEILERVVDLVRPGISTKEVDQAAADLMTEAGVPGVSARASRIPGKYLYFAQ